MKLADNTSYPSRSRKQFLEQAYQVLQNNPDSLSAERLSQVSWKYLTSLNDTLRFKTINKIAREHALKLQDSSTMANIHWNEAYLYKYTQVYDSAYYHYNEAYKLFDAIDAQPQAVRMLYGMAHIKGRFGDYTGSETLTVNAIAKSKKLKDFEFLFACYNHLALLHHWDMNNPNRALFYYNKALEYLNKVKNSEGLKGIVSNNIGLVYVEKGQYNKAFDYFNAILKDDSLKIKNPMEYAKVLDNRAYGKLLNKDTLGVRQELLTALKIRDSLGNSANMVMSSIHLAEYYAFVKDTINALLHAQNAKHYSADAKNSWGYLSSLELLSKFDKTNAQDHLERHIAYTDSMQEADRKIQNKFARIELETDEYIEETQRLSKERMQLMLIGLAVVLVLSLVFYIRFQTVNAQKLRLEAQQQKTNEQVYLLSMEQQEKLEEEKVKERNRISRELHDGILGDLFGVRMGLGYLDLKGKNGDLTKYQTFVRELQDIEKDIREVSHKLHTDMDSSTVNFNAMLGQLVENKSEQGDFECALNIDKSIDWGEVNGIAKTNIYRIAQEALQNIVKYAKAQKVALDFSKHKGKIYIDIQDDGVGFNIKRRTIRKGIGIKNILSRAEKLKGEANIRSKIGKGTSLHVSIPINNQNS